MRFLERRCAAHDGVGLVDRHFTDALKAPVRWVERADSRCGKAVVEPRCDVGAVQRVFQHLFAVVVVETRDTQQVTEHAQYFPGRPRFRERLHDAAKTLHAAFGTYESARGFRKRRHRQQRVSVG